LEQVILSSPVLNEGELESLLNDPSLKPQVLPTFFDIHKGVDGSLEKTLNKLCEAADEAVRNGSQLLVLSDRSDELVRAFQLPSIFIPKFSWFSYLNLILSSIGEFISTVSMS
jgi:hypothetical protein